LRIVQRHRVGVAKVVDDIGAGVDRQAFDRGTGWSGPSIRMGRVRAYDIDALHAARAAAPLHFVFCIIDSLFWLETIAMQEGECDDSLLPMRREALGYSRLVKNNFPSSQFFNGNLGTNAL
jgi:hypothetical protein